MYAGAFKVHKRNNWGGWDRAEQQQRATERAEAWASHPNVQALMLVDENECPGHVASADPKVCRHCGTHIDSLRPDDDDQNYMGG